MQDHDGRADRYPPLYLSTEIDSAWQERAACREHPELDWTPKYRPPQKAKAAMMAVCASCPVRVKCAHWALHHEVASGMFAGVWVPDYDHKWPPARRALWLAARAQLTQIGNKNVCSDG